MRTVAEYVALINKEIESVATLRDEPYSLFSLTQYALQGGGKRLRPVLTLAVTEALGGDIKTSMYPAFAIEIFHNFTLVHDDIMDRSEMRHGRPSIWKKVGEPTAILAGDVMLTCANLLLNEAECIDLETLRDINYQFNMTALNVYRGQQYDMEFEKRNDVTLDEYMMMIGYKTASLITGACNIGALVAKGSRMAVAQFVEYGDNIGLAFQLQDDILDTYGDASFGKPIGGDILNDKKTWLNIVASQEAPEAMAAACALSGQAKIDAVRAVYDSLDLRNRCEAVINTKIDVAIAAVKAINLSDDKTAFFTDLALSLVGRKK